MASRKKRLKFADYADAMDRVARLRAKGDTDGEEYLAAIEAATQFFLRDHESARFNSDDQDADLVHHLVKKRKWLTIKDLMDSL
jgi:hypothetical protein